MGSGQSKYGIHVWVPIHHSLLYGWGVDSTGLVFPYCGKAYIAQWKASGPSRGLTEMRTRVVRKILCLHHKTAGLTRVKLEGIGSWIWEVVIICVIDKLRAVLETKCR